MKDIYFPEKEIEVRSREHVLLNALGGQLKSPLLINQDTNSKFGDTIDTSLEQVFALIRVPLNLLSGEGGRPSHIGGLKLPDGRSASVSPGGNLHLPTKPTFKEIDNQLHIGGEIHSIADLMKYGEKFFKKYNVTREMVENGAEIRYEYLPPAQFQRPIGVDALRCVAKMACNLLAHHSRDLFLRADFDDIRRFVAIGGDPYDHLAYLAEPVSIDAGAGVETIGMGDLDHLLLVRGNQRTGRVEALVALYKHLQMVVLLGTTDLSALSGNLYLSYRVDQLGHTHRYNDARDHALLVPEFQRLALNTDVIAQAMTRVHNFVAQKGFQKWLNQLIEETVADYVQSTPLPEIITEEYIGGLAQALTQRFQEEWGGVRQQR